MKLYDIVLVDGKLSRSKEFADILLNSSLRKEVDIAIVNDDSFEKHVSMPGVKSYAIVTNLSEKPSDIAKRFISNSIIDMSKVADIDLVKNAEWVLGLKDRSSASKTFIISDTHFGHANIIKYCNRPWNSGKTVSTGEIVVSPEDVERMNNAMISNWNSVVPEDGIVWHLGDFAFGDMSKAADIVKQLNGKINLVLGNHDRKKVKVLSKCGFNCIYDHPIIIDKFVILTHEPIDFLNENCPFYQCFGHVHDSTFYKTWSKNGCCACVERHNYTPVSMEKVREMYLKLNDGNAED